MLSSSSEGMTVFAQCSHKIYEMPHLLRIIFDYASLNFYSSFPKSFITSQDMSFYKIFLEQIAEQTKRKISEGLEEKKRSETRRYQAKLKLAHDRVEREKEHIRTLESSMQMLTLQYEQTLQEINENQSLQERALQEDLLNNMDAICALINLFEMFERLFIEELNNKSWWSRIKIDRDLDYSRRIEDGLCIIMAAMLVILMTMGGLIALCLNPTVSFLIPVVAHAVMSHIFLHFTLAAGVIGGLIIAGINGLFKIDRRGNERFNQDSLISLSPAKVEKFEEIKAVQSTFVGDDPEITLANVSSQSSLIDVCSVFGRNVTFFKKLVVRQETQEENEEKNTLTSSVKNN